jgi:hypothetical protein
MEDTTLSMAIFCSAVKAIKLPNTVSSKLLIKLFNIAYLKKVTV